jgi:serine/threonine protein kinase
MNNHCIRKNPQKSLEDSFMYFINNSKLELISDTSAYGFVYKCIFQENENKSPYFFIDSNGINRNVLNIVIKLVLVAKEKYIYLDEEEILLEWNYIKDKKLNKFYYNSIQYFLHEALSQQSISEKGKKKLHKNTPTLLYSRLFVNDTKKYEKIERTLLQKAVEKQPLQQMFSEFNKINKIQPREHLLQNNFFYFSLIAMEYIGSPYILCNDIIKPIILDEIKSKTENKDIHKHDSKVLSSKSDRLRWIYNIRRYEVLRLGIDTGYSQGDYHTENMFIDEENKRAMIIDFSYSKEINKIFYIIKLWNELLENNFIDMNENIRKISIILQEIYNVHFKNEKKEFTEYKWLKEVEKEDIQQIIEIHRSNL